MNLGEGERSRRLEVGKEEEEEVRVKGAWFPAVGGVACCRATFFLAMLWLMDWLIQEAARDLVKAEEGVGEGEGAALIDEGLPEEEEEEEKDGEEGVKAEVGEGEETGRALTEEDVGEEGETALIDKDPLEEGVGEKHGRALETAVGEVTPLTEEGEGEDAGTALSGEVQGGAWI